MQWNTPGIKTGAYDIVERTITVNIYDTETLIADDADPEIIPLTAAGNPLNIQTNNNEEDKFSPIRPKRAVIRFLSRTDLNQSMTTFSDSSDNRWKVEILCSGHLDPIFLGFLMLSDMQQLFYPDSVVVELNASDHLGILKDLPLTNDAGINPVGKYRIADYLAWCLKKTGLSLDIKAIMNVRHGSGYRRMEATFNTAAKTITVSANNTFFYLGQEFSIGNTSSNDGAGYTVKSIAYGANTVVTLNQSVVNETNANTDFGDDHTGHFYDKVYLDARTFESSIGESENCYDVLSKILGEDCYLCQWKGAWWIIRVDENDDNLMYPFRFDPDGVADDYITPINPTRPIGANAEAQHANASTNLRQDRPNKFIKETFKYENPAELVCNEDFSRGDVITPPDLAAGEATGTYELDCWTLRKTAGSVTSTKFVTKKYNFGYPKESYAVITPQTGSATPYDFIESQAVEVNQKDKGNFSVDFRFANDITGSGNYSYFLVKIYIKGDDGKWYYWWSTDDLDDPDTYRWTTSPVETDRAIASTWNLGNIKEGNYIDGDGNLQQGDWQSVSVDLSPIPVDGKLYIGLYQGKQGGHSSDNQNIYYQNLQLDIIPFINGSYERYTGHYNKVTRLINADKYNATREKQVYLGDAPRPINKGAMFFLRNDGVYKLCQHFYAANVNALGDPDPAGLHAFGYLQAYSVWNQSKNANRIFPSTFYGFFDMAGQWPDLPNKFQLSDVNPNTSFRYFMLVVMDQDWKSMIWTATLIEMYKNPPGHEYGDPLELKYITS